MVVTCALGLTLDRTVRAAQAAYLSVLTVVLLEAAVRAVRHNLEGTYSNSGLLQHVAGTTLVALSLTLLGEHFEVGRPSGMSGLTLAVQVALAVRIFQHVEAVWVALGREPEVPSLFETYGPAHGPPDGPGKAGDGA